MIAMRISWIFRDIEKTFLSFSISPLPNSKVRFRLIDVESEADITPNIATIPPTALYIP